MVHIMAQLSKKISVKSIVGNVKVMVRDGEIKDGQNVMRAYGTASTVIGGDSDYGPWIAFKGNFKAENLLTGEVVASGKLFLPEVGSDLLEGAVNGCDGQVEFAFDIGVKYDDDSATGYIYTATPLLEAAEDEAMNRIEQNFAAKLDAPASKKAAK